MWEHVHTWGWLPEWKEEDIEKYFDKYCLIIHCIVCGCCFGNMIQWDQSPFL